MIRPTLRRALLQLLFLAAAGCALAAAAADPALTVKIGAQGLTTLSWNGAELLQSGDFKVTGAFFRKADGTVYGAAVDNPKTSAGTNLLGWQFPWGRIQAQYAAQATRLDLRVTVEIADSADTLVALYLQVAELKFPQPPTFRNPSFFFYGQTTMAHNLGAPGIVVADFGKGAVAACNEQVDRPLCFGFGLPADGKGSVTYPVLAYTGRHPMLKEKWPFIDRPVPPGGRDVLELSLRFGPTGAVPEKIATDLYAKFAAAFPFELKWTDRRPIGALFISSAHPADDKWKTNPRGWLNQTDIDTTSDKGLAEFRDRFQRWGEGALKICQDMDAQGIICWDPEGQEHPHMISYLGDPRSLPPEIEPLIDAFFQRFRDAGLRTGICIRPQRPLRAAYGNAVEQLAFTDHRDRVANLNAKIAYAKKRWGCTLFYMDSDVDWSGDPVQIPGAEGYSATIDAQLLRELLKANPDILIIPEWEDLRSYAYAAPYSQLNYNKLLAPPPDVLAAYPQAFFVNRCDEKFSAENEAALVAAVRRGDILLFSGWWASPENAIVKRICEAAKK